MIQNQVLKTILKPRLLGFGQSLYVGILGAAILMGTTVPLAWSQTGSNATKPVDLTGLIKSIEDNNTAPIPSAAPSLRLSGLQQKDPSSIRLAALGNERESVDGLDRFMWEGSDAPSVLALQKKLTPLPAIPSSLMPGLHHVMAARAVPPSGFIDLASEMITLRLKWLAANGASDDLAGLIRQLPEDDWGGDWQEWLVHHNLMTRNDDEACRLANRKIALTLAPLWHQINAFCSVVAGDKTKAVFALDILQDSGVDDPLYFALMRRLTTNDGGNNGADDFDQSGGVSPLNLILLDSARIPITPEALLKTPASFGGSIETLRYLNDDARRLLAARSFGKMQPDELAATWGLMATAGIPSAEALTRFRFGGDADTVLLARLNAWQAIAAEKDDRARAQLALDALASDYGASDDGYASTARLNLWLGFIEGGVDDPDLANKIGALLGFAAPSSKSSPSKIAMGDIALAWQELLKPSSRPISADAINIASAHDVIPLLTAVGQPIEPQDWLTYKGRRDRLSAGGGSIAYADIMATRAAAEKGLKAETLLRVAAVLGGGDLATLTREDAAALAGALTTAGLDQSARGLAREIITAWGLKRHFNGADIDEVNSR